MTNYYIELTDLFGGELNYSYIKRYTTKAKSIQGAIGKLSREIGLNFRAYDKTSYDGVYHSTSKLTGVWIEEYETNDSSHISANCHTEEL
jgi:hypothetical protein